MYLCSHLDLHLCQVVDRMVPLDVLYTASSLARFQIYDPSIFELLSKKILSNPWLVRPRRRALKESKEGGRQAGHLPHAVLCAGAMARPLVL